MPVTKGAGNPVWLWDETLLALDVLYRHGRPVDKGHGDVRELSEVLRAAKLHPADARKDNFRNADGVALKLQNLFSAVEPGRGLSFSKTDRLAVEAYPSTKRQELADTAKLIMLRLISDEREFNPSESDVVFREGQILTVRHRKRDARLRALLIKSKRSEGLRCQICAFEPPRLERALQESFFEAHHIVPLSFAEGEVVSRIKDAALLCAGCHRFIHRLISTTGEWVSVEQAAHVLAASSSA